jgi:hypothetical protein
MPELNYHTGPGLKQGKVKLISHLQALPDFILGPLSDVMAMYYPGEGVAWAWHGVDQVNHPTRPNFCEAKEEKPKQAYAWSSGGLQFGSTEAGTWRGQIGRNFGHSVYGNCSCQEEI